MENFSEIRKKAEEARKNQNWQQALEFYKKIYQNKNANNWDKFFYALSMSKMGNYADSLEICRKIYASDKNFMPNNSLYARNIYNTTFLTVDYSKQDVILKALKALKTVISKGDKYVSFEMFVYKIIKRLEQDKKYQLILWLLEQVKPDDFDYKVINDKDYLDEIRYPGFVETYYVAKIKANYNVGNYEDVIKLSDEAIEILPRFHYDNDIWIRRIKAMSLERLDREKEAVKEYFFILKRKKDWFLYFELSKILQKAENTEASEYFAMKSLQIRQKAIYKIKLFAYVRDVLQYENLEQEMTKIIALLKQKTADEAEQKELNKKIRAIEKQIEQKVNEYFENKKGQGQIYKSFGKRNGIIRLEDGKTIYYYAENKNLNPQIGEKYSFVETWNYDFKKNIEKKSVILIKKL